MAKGFVSHTSGKDAPIIVGSYHEIKDWSMDEKGYFLIRINNENQMLEAAYCEKAGIIKLIFQGKKPQDIYYEIHKKNLISRMDHAAYLGKELEKAYLAMRSGKKYIQDSPLEL